jgi:hypothetical protein
MFYGEDFWVEDLPVGTRVICSQAAARRRAQPEGRHSLRHQPPLGMDPLHALLSPGMKVTIALDDISLPLPPMKRPDVRQRVLEIVLELLATHGVDDVHLIIANALHRRMTEPEMKRMVGRHHLRRLLPRPLLQPRRRRPRRHRRARAHRPQRSRRHQPRAAESDLLIYVNINLVPMDGGHKSVGTGLTNYASLRAHHNP